MGRAALVGAGTGLTSRQARTGRTRDPAVSSRVAASGPAALRRRLGSGARQRTRPYQTRFVQMRSSLTTEPVFGECQILPLPA